MVKASSTLDTLPDDIVLEIITAVIDSEDYQFTEYSDVEAARRQNAKATAVIGASQICRTWRDAALGCQWIWGTILTIDNSSPIWIDILLERTENAPIYIYSNPSISRAHMTDFCSPVWATLFQRVVQWKVLDLTVYVTPDVYTRFRCPRNASDDDLLDRAPELLRPLMVALTKPAPVLECFILHFAGSDAPLFNARQTKYIPDELFAGVTPHLRRFYFHDIASSTLLSFRSSKMLTHLNIDSSGMPSASFSTVQWLQILKGQTQLVSLNITGNFATHEPKHEPGLQEIQLPGLRFFQVVCHDVEASAVLFAKLVVPPTCIVKIELDLENPTSRTWKSLPLTHLQTGFQRFLRKWPSGYKEDSIYNQWNIQQKHGLFSLAISRQSDQLSESGPMFIISYTYPSTANNPTTQFLKMVLENVPGTVLWDTMKVDTDFKDVQPGDERNAYVALLTQFSNARWPKPVSLPNFVICSLVIS